MKKIILDIYGADAGEKEIIAGAVKALNSLDDIHLVMVGDKTTIENVMVENSVSADRYSIIDTDKQVTNNDPPTCVFAGGEEYSMVKALKHLKKSNDCIGLISPGNTGALLIGTICHLGLVKGLKLPALSAHMKTVTDKLVYLVDCGANVECTAKDLVNFALMGKTQAQCMTDVENPKVALLSVGKEDSKGNPLTKEAFSLLKDKENINFIGNIEGTNILDNSADVIVADGFAGNIVLKNTEATGKACIAIIEKLTSDITSVTEKEVIERIKTGLMDKFDLNSQGGATFLGTKKTVIKMHGVANSDTVVSCIKQLDKLESNGFSKLISTALN